MNTFIANQNQHYRAQLQAVQVDMTLVLRADPYSANGPLEDSGEEIRQLIEDILAPDANGNRGVTLPEDEAVKEDFWSMAGKRYGQFVRDANDAIEQRDADLTQLRVSIEWACCAGLRDADTASVC